MSIKVISSVWKHSACRGGALHVLLAIADCADDAGRAYPGVTLLSKKARLSPRQTRRAIATLVQKNELRGPHRTNVYWVTIYQDDKMSGVTMRGKDTDISRSVGVSSTSPNPSSVFVIEPSGGDHQRSPPRLKGSLTEMRNVPLSQPRR